MNAPVLTYVSTFEPATVLKELDRVRLLRDMTSDEGVLVSAGTFGTVLAVWSDGQGFEIECRDFDGLVSAGFEDVEQVQD